MKQRLAAGARDQEAGRRHPRPPGGSVDLAGGGTYILIVMVAVIVTVMAIVMIIGIVIVIVIVIVIIIVN